MTFNFGIDSLSTSDLYKQSKGSGKFSLPEVSLSKVKKFRKIVDGALASGETYYGINTGFGYLSDVKIASDQLEQLQNRRDELAQLTGGNSADDAISFAESLLSQAEEQKIKVTQSK